MYKIQEFPEMSVIRSLHKYNGSLCKVILQVQFILKQYRVKPFVIYCRVAFLNRGHP